MGTIRRYKVSMPTAEGKRNGELLTVSVQCSCGAVNMDEPVATGETCRERALDFVHAHCGATHGGRAA